MTASSEYDIHFSPRLGRLNSVPSGSDGGAWCGLAILGEWIQVYVLLILCYNVNLKLNIDETCLKVRSIKGILVGQCFIHLTREDQQVHS